MEDSHQLDSLGSQSMYSLLHPFSQLTEVCKGKWTMNKEDGLPYVFEDFIQENNGSRNDGIVKLQGLISFVDSREEDGGFCLVPGFQKHLKEWAELTKDTSYYVNGQNKYTLIHVPPGNIPFLLSS